MKALWITVFVVAFCGCVANRPVPLDDTIERGVEGAAIGAAAGAVGGAIAGNAGKGAAIGAAVGGTLGILSEVFGGSRYGTVPCARWPEGSTQRNACMRGYEDASAVEAERQGRCAGGDRSACGHGGWYGRGYSLHRYRGYWW